MHKKKRDNKSTKVENRKKGGSRCRNSGENKNRSTSRENKKKNRGRRGNMGVQSMRKELGKAT